MERVFFFLGAISGFLSVALGAFGAHALKSRLPVEQFNIFEVGVRYQIMHTLALLAVAAAFARFSNPFMSASGWLFIAGTIIFSGSLYILALSGIRYWGAVTPVGGLILLTGWVSLGMGVLKG